jgi:predicted GH43/DUF377 family glycosyl hydrolase
MLKVKKEGVLLQPTALPFESRAVLNPAVYQEGNKVHLIYRAIDQEYISSFGYARLNGPLNIAERWDKPFMSPTHKIEKKGIEDPRIVKIDNIFYMTYVVHDGKNAISFYVSGKDLFNMERGAVISPKIPYSEADKIFAHSKLKDKYYFYESYYQEFGGKNVLIWHKDCILFPEKINGKFQMIHRILPDIQLIGFDDFSQLEDKYYWLDYLINHLAENVMMESVHGFESRHLGGGTPPIKTAYGWLMIYHAVQEFNKKRIYSAGAALLDLTDPKKVLARLPYPLISPTEDFELTGTVNNVIFPTGTTIFDNRLYIYYGAADTKIAVASVNLQTLINELLNYKITD